jgi:CBS-domain-containing membrane protein
MSHPVVSATPNVELSQLAALLAEHRVGAVPVVDPDGRALGIVTEADLSRAAGAGGPATAVDVMSAPVMIAHCGDSVIEVQREMQRFGVGRLPVLDDAGRVIGIVTGSDVNRSRQPRPVGDGGVRRRVIDRVIDAGGEVLGLQIDDGLVRLRVRVGSCSEIPVIEHLIGDVPGISRLELVVESVDEVGRRHVQET